MSTHRVGSAALIVLGLAWPASGCSSTRVEPTPEAGRVASLSLGLDASGTFAGKSLRISGRRATAADGKYPCLSRFDDVCIDFPSDALDGAGGKSVVDELCPSADLPRADGSTALWDFDFVLHEGAGCVVGTELTGAGKPVTCYERSSFGVTGAENKVRGELLAPGANTNSIICVTRETPPAAPVADAGAPP